MRWAYDDDTRDLFGKGIHRDILIVPHATNVEKVEGGPPRITSKVPEFKWNETGGKDHTGQYEPVKENGHYVYQDVEWIITNDDIVKEKFKYSSSLNSDDNLTFSSCNATMIQFTIRNKKEYVLDEETQEYYWKPEIPNLFKYEYTQKDGNGNTQKIVGELMSNTCIKAYMYFNGDSSTLMYLGMFKVEEDKLIDNGYNRQITAYDFLAWFREIDIFYWYKHLFEGINKLGNDYEDYTNDTDSKKKHTQAEWDKNYIREPKEKWTIGEALNDLIDHFAAYDMTVFEEEVVNEETGEKKNVMKLGATSTNPNDYGRDDYEEGNGYTGLGMPIILDSNVMTKGAKPYMPTEPGPNEKEQYGYMNILELEFYQDPKIMKSESLSAGKLLEDIGLLAGRYPYIRTDEFVDGDYIDPKTITPTEEEKHPSKYICYEKCILTFKPLPSAENDKNVDKVPESMFDNHDIVKGFQHDYYQVQDITVMKFELDDGTEIKYSKLTKDQLVAEQKSELQTFTITNNMFANYLVTKSDDDDVKKMLDKYKVIREKLFGKNSTAGNMSPDALFNQGYNNIKNRIYTPYQLTTFADPVRDVGDRIKIDFTDILTGEQSHFYTYILERSMEGIQKCMDTYTAKGTMRNPLFTNYQTSSKSKSGGDTSQTSEDLDIMTPFDLIEYMRNCGYRMLDEPTDCEAVFAKGSEGEIDLTKNHIYYTSSYPQETYIKDGDTVNKITVGGQEIDIIEGDYVIVKNYQHDDPMVTALTLDPEHLQYEYYPLYVYTANSEWKYVGLRNWGGGYWDEWQKNLYNSSGEAIHFIDEVDNWIDVSEFDKPIRSNKIATRLKIPTDYNYWWDDPEVDPPTEYYVNDIDTHYKVYGGNNWEEPYTTYTEPITSEAQFGDFAEISYLDESYGEGKWHSSTIYQYPGFWTSRYNYPDLTKKIKSSSKPYVQLKWSDPPDINTWEPYPCAWEGTVIVRKEDAAPLHRWDGEKVVLNKTRDKYKTKGYKDEDIKMGRTYYYGFFPYYTADDSDPEHPIRYYTFTKVIKVETGDNSIASTIDSIDVNGNTATINYTLSQPDSATFASVKIYGKIGSNPSCDDTDDVMVDVDDGSSSKDISGLEYESTYYFCLVTVDSNDEELSSNIEVAQIEADPGPQPDPSVIQYINTMNNRQAYGFMWKTCPQTFSYRKSGIDYYCTVIYKYSDVSYYVFNTNGEVGYDFSFNERGWGLVPYLCTTGHMDTIYITSDGNGNYSCTVGPLTIVPGVNTQYSTKYYSWKMSSSNSGSSFAQYLYWDNDGGMSGKSFSTTKSSIVSLFEWLSQKVRNVKIYVDGVLWADPTYEQN